MARKKRLGKSSLTGDAQKVSRDVEKPGSDYLLDAAQENWPYILEAYHRFEDNKPIVLYDIQERRIYVYPYAGFIEELSEKSRLTLKDQYQRAVQENKIVVFVRDNDQRKLVSFSMNYESLCKRGHAPRTSSCRRRGNSRGRALPGRGLRPSDRPTSVTRPRSGHVTTSSSRSRCSRRATSCILRPGRRARRSRTPCVTTVP
jgi:hypothetical protein